MIKKHTQFTKQLDTETSLLLKHSTDIQHCLIKFYETIITAAVENNCKRKL